MGLIREIQFALRRWRSRPLVALTASLTLALGIGATTSVFSIVDAVLLRPLPYPQADRLVNVWGTFPEWRANPASAETWDRVALSWPEFVELRAGTATLDEIALDGGHRQSSLKGHQRRSRDGSSRPAFSACSAQHRSWDGPSSHRKMSAQRKSSSLVMTCGAGDMAATRR